MARGFSSVKEAGADIEKRKNAAAEGDFPKRVYFDIDPGQSAVVRFLEQGDEVNWAWVHELDPFPGKTYGPKVPCRDQDEEGRKIGESCPGCEDDRKRSFRGVINLIWRGGGEDGEDVVATWIKGPVVFVDTLDPLDTTYKGLSSRDFTITRKGSGRDTTFNIFPTDPDGGPKALSKADKALAEEKPDLTYFVEAPSYDEWGKPKQKKEDPTASGITSDSPFKRPR